MAQTTADPVNVFIHPSQFPAAVAEQLRESLRARRMNHKFHYDTPRQAAAWLRVHEAYSPARRDADCGQMYALAFADVAKRLANVNELDVVSLGAGGGQKDAVLLRALLASNPTLRCQYISVDVSAGLSLVSRAAAVEAGVPSKDCLPMVMDLTVEPDWAGALSGVTRSGVRRVICFFGMLPNFESEWVFARLAQMIGHGDVLLVSANLAPGPSYADGVAQVRPQYDNELTREWLLTSLLNIGVERGDGVVSLGIEEWPQGSGLLRLKGEFTFAQARTIRCEGETFSFVAGDGFQLFFSYRYTPDILETLFRQQRMRVAAAWLNPAGDEGLFRVTGATD